MVVFIVVMALVFLRGSTEFAFAPASLKTLPLFASAISETLILTPARLAAWTARPPLPSGCGVLIPFAVVPPALA